MTQNHTFTMNEAQARLVHQLADQQCRALKNWIASAVEDGDLHRAQLLCRDLRAHQALFAAFNMDAKHTIAEGTGKPVKTAHAVRAAR